MPKRYFTKIYTFVQSYYFGSLLYLLSVVVVIAWSVVLIASPAPFGSRQAEAKPLLNVSTYQEPKSPPYQPEAKSEQGTLSTASVQPALETWQGPIEPIPENPTQPSIPIVITIPTTEPVVFLTVDDGWVQTPEESIWLTQHHLPFTLFLTDNGIKNNYKFFQLLQSAGMSIEDHTVSHPDLTRLTLDQQKAEICGAADKYADVFGRRPTKLRPPYGKANQLTIQAAQMCGMKQIVMWRAVVEKGVIHYQDNNTHFNPGDIVLMHFTNDFSQDIEAFINQANADHLQVANLEDWLP